MCRFHAISAKFAEKFSNRDKDLVVGFTVKHEEHKYGFCGGGYIKLLPGDFDHGNSDHAYILTVVLQLLLDAFLLSCTVLLLLGTSLDCHHRCTHMFFSLNIS